MCHNCGAHLPKSDDETRKLHNGSHITVNGVAHSCSCRFCQEKLEQEHTMLTDSLTVGPSTSLSSSDRSVSICSKILPFQSLIDIIIVFVHL